MKSLVLSILIVCTLAMSGCMAGMFPTIEHRSSRTGTRGEIPVKSIDFIQPGTTTRADVILALGEPDLVLDDDKWFAYRWVMTSGYWFVFVYAGYSGGGSMNECAKTYGLLIEFDDRGIVNRFKVKNENFASDLTFNDLVQWD